jgi:GR25 family glycosyltransferase involved in LPS biosynthesis
MTGKNITNYGKYKKELEPIEIEYMGFVPKFQVDNSRLEQVVNNPDFITASGINDVFLINMDKSKIRFRKMKKKLASVGITNYKRMRGFNGMREIPKMRKQLPEFSILDPEKLSTLNETFIKNIEYDSVGVGQQGCACSHLYLYKYMVQENIPIALIMEDDLCFHPEFKKLFLQGWVNRPRKGVLFNFLSSQQDTKPSCFESEKLVWKKYALWSCAFYIITKEGANRILETVSKKNFPILPTADSPPYSSCKDSYKLHYNNHNVFDEQCGNRRCGIVGNPLAGDKNSEIHTMNKIYSDATKNIIVTKGNNKCRYYLYIFTLISLSLMFFYYLYRRFTVTL